jgi:1-acyl-sn-glycerol-3-phosphate acyltransferase
MDHPEGSASSISLAAQILLLNAAFWILAAAVTLVFLLVGTPYVTAVGLLTRNRRRTLRLLRLTIGYYGATILRCGWPLVRVRFVDLSPADKPPFILVANHRSSSDPFLMARLPRWECIQVLNNWPARIPVLGVVSRIAGYLKVRQMPIEDFIQMGSNLLAEGCSIITFPEGTRSGSTRMGPFHGAAFRLAQRTGAKIVPIAISGNENIPPRGSMLLRPGRISVTKLPALTAEQYADMTPYALKTRVHDIIERQLESPAT